MLASAPYVARRQPSKVQLKVINFYFEKLIRNNTT